MAERSKSNRTWWIVGGVIVLVVAVVTALVVTTGGSEDETAAPAPEQTQQEEPDESAETDSGENIPGAEIGNTQRSWPDPAGSMDDSAHTTPGEYSSDILARPVWTPENHEGDLPASNNLVDGMGQCSEPQDITLEGQTQIQYVNARYLVVNEQAGPSEMEGGLPTGYAQSPQGAVLAAINQSGYGLYAQGDEIGYAADEKYWQDSETAQEEREFFKMDERGPSEMARAMMVPAPESFQIEACTDELVVVSVAYTDGQGGSYTMQLPMTWKDGEWQSNLAGNADDLLNQPNADITEFTPVEYS